MVLAAVRSWMVLAAVHSWMVLAAARSWMVLAAVRSWMVLAMCSRMTLAVRSGMILTVVSSGMILAVRSWMVLAVVCSGMILAAHFVKACFPLSTMTCFSKQNLLKKTDGWKILCSRYSFRLRLFLPLCPYVFPPIHPVPRISICSVSGKLLFRVLTLLYKFFL